MKKLLVLMLVLGMTSIAGASTVVLTDDGLTINAMAGDTVRLTLTSDTGLLGLDAIATVIGGDVITAATSTVDAAAYGWDAGFSFDPTGIGTAAAEIGLGNFNGNYQTIVAYFDVLYTGGTQIVELTAGSALGGSSDIGFGVPAISGMVTIVPEPATLALLGLGGLALLRRKK